MKVSIIITCFNREKFIARAIRSAISQNFSRRQFEVIVVDDGSTDNSRKIIEDFGDSIITIFNTRNLGLPSARNIGIRKAKGRFVVHLDSDDYLHDECIYSEHIHLALNTAWGAVACDYVEIDDHEAHISRKKAEDHPIACGIMFRKENLINIGLYDERMLVCEDEELRQRFEKRYEIGFVHLPLYRYTRHKESLTHNSRVVSRFRKKIKKLK